MKLNDCIVNCPETGEGEIDLVKAFKSFDERCSISKWKDEYTLLRRVYKNQYSMKMRIHKEDALALIYGLRLVEVPSMFKSGSTFIK